MYIYDTIALRAKQDKAIQGGKTKKGAKMAIAFTIAFFVLIGFSVEDAGAVEKSEIIKAYKSNDVYCSNYNATTTACERYELEEKVLVKKKGKKSKIENGEIKKLRKENKQTFKIDNNTFLDKIYPTEKFYLENDTWYEIESEKISVEAYNNIVAKNSLLNILLHIRPVFASSSDIFPASDGTWRSAGTDWADAWSNTSATDVYNSQANYFIFKNEEHAGGGFIYRSGLSFKIDLPTDVNIDSVKLYAYITEIVNQDNDGLDYIHISEGNFSTSTLVASDYNVTNFSTTSLNNLIDISDLVDEQYNAITFNQTGINYVEANKNDWIKLALRGGHDVENTAVNFGTINSVDMYYSEQTGTANDPYIEIVYSSSEISTPTSTPSEGGGRIDYIYIYDTETETTNYIHVPFFNFLLLFLVISFSLHISMLIIKRRK